MEAECSENLSYLNEKKRKEEAEEKQKRKEERERKRIAYINLHEEKRLERDRKLLEKGDCFDKKTVQHAGKIELNYSVCVCVCVCMCTCVCACTCVLFFLYVCVRVCVYMCDSVIKFSGQSWMLWIPNVDMLVGTMDALHNRSLEHLCSYTVGWYVDCSGSHCCLLQLRAAMSEAA